MQPAFKKLCTVSAVSQLHWGGYIYSQHPTLIAKAIKVVCTGLRNSQFAPSVCLGEKADIVTISRHIAQISKGRDQLQLSVLQRCPSDRGVR